MNTPQAEMPRYKSHKTVWALKIAKVEPLPNPDQTGQTAASHYGLMLTPENTSYASFSVGPNYQRKHDPQPGGYYVVYADGYQSFSPAQAFEEGNTPEGAREPDHASDVLYPAIKAAMTELESLHAGFSMEVNRAYNHLHGAFWSECPRPASMPDLRPTEPSQDGPNPA